MEISEPLPPQSKNSALDQSSSQNLTTKSPSSPLPIPTARPTPQEVIILPSKSQDTVLLTPRVLHVSSGSLVLRWEPLSQVTYYQISVNDVLNEKRITSVIFALNDLLVDHIAKIQVLGFNNKGLQVASSHVMEVNIPALPISGRGGSSQGKDIQPVPTPTVGIIEVQQSFKYQGFNYAEQGFVLEPTRELLLFALAPGILRAINQDMEIDWEFDAGDYISGAPVSTSWGRTFVGTLDGRVIAIDSYGGVTWEKQLEEGEVVIQGLAVNENDGLLYLTTHTGSLYAIDVYGGYVHWRRPLSDGFDNPPVISASGDVLVGDTMGNWFLIDSETELQAWNYSTAITEKTSLGIALDGLFYLSFEESGLRCVDKRGHLIWSFDEAGVVGSPVVDARGYIYFITTQQKLVVIDTWGKVLRRLFLPSPATGHLLLDEQQNLYVVTAEDLLVFNEDGYRVGRADLEESVPGALGSLNGSLWLMGSLGGIMQYPMYSPLSPYALWPRSYGATSNQNMFKREGF